MINAQQLYMKQLSKFNCLKKKWCPPLNRNSFIIQVTKNLQYNVNFTNLKLTTIRALLKFDCFFQMSLSWSPSCTWSRSNLTKWNVSLKKKSFSLITSKTVPVFFTWLANKEIIMCMYFACSFTYDQLDALIRTNGLIG